MRKSIASLLVVATLFSLFSCSKSHSDPSGNNSGGGGTPPPPPTTTTLEYKNNTFTSISITVNNVTKSIDAGSSATFTGTAGTSATGTATTSGKTTSGTQIGLLISWTLSNTFPASASQTVPLDVSSDYFFLKVIDNSALPMVKIYVNYGLTAQTLDNITVAADGKSYSLGYYHGYTNSNARAENGNTYWYWSSLNLTGTINQLCMLTGN